MLGSCACIVVSLIMRKHVRKATNLQQHYTSNDHHTTNDASFLQVEMSDDFWSAAQYVNPFVELIQQLQCGIRTLSGVENFLIVVIS